MVELRLIGIVTSEGAVEILEFLKEAKTAHFNDFRTIKNARTGRIFSANTLSAKLKLLEEAGAIERIVSTSPKRRNVVAYRMTKSGGRSLEAIYRCEKELGTMLGHPAV